MTTVINLFGGPGLGKSTTAAGLFYEMKLRGFDVELVREYAKNFAYHKTMPDQTYIFAKQLKAESTLYGKVDFIVTDSPLWLCCYYEALITGARHLLPLVKAQVAGRKEHNLFLQRFKPYHQNGRLQTPEEASQIDLDLSCFLGNEGVPYQMVQSKDRDRVADILDLLALSPTVKQ